MTRIGTLVVSLLLAAGFASAAGGQAAAQTLGDVETLARDGRVSEARETLTGWWETGWSAASRDDRQRALWYRGMLTLAPDQAATQYRRLAIEYPGGPWSAQALLRLGRIALLDGDLTLAARHFEDLVRDYPASGARLEAAEWLSENADRVEAARSAAVAPPGSRDEEAPPPTAEPPAPVAAESTSTPVPTDAAELWTVQLGAFSTVERARTLADRVRAAGYQPRLVRVGDSDLVRLRVGLFEDATDARTLYDAVVRAGFEATVARDAAREVPIGQNH